MNQLLKTGQKVRSEHTGLDCEVGRFLGGGGQGEVYQAIYHGHPMALKWYFLTQATAEQHEALERLVKKGPPDARFLWPVELTSAAGVPGFGYLMALRPPAFKGIVDLMKRRCDPSFRTLVKTGFQVADSYLQLHTRGFCYRDISFGNVFFDPGSGDILICDNDNVAVDDGTASGGVLGTPRFMAPEIVRGEASPSSQTDLYSLSVLLFYLYVVHHPLEGKRESSIKCLDLPAMNMLYGFKPLFIYDPDDDSNRPDKGYQDNAIVYWNIYPKFFQELFIRAFTTGLRDPLHGRVRESEWRQALARLGDAILYCGYCGSENFYDEQVLKDQGKLTPCWSCQKEVKIPPRMRIGKNIVMLNHDARLYLHHVDDSRLYDFTASVSEMTRSPSDPNVWGLRNLSDTTWTVTRSDGSMQSVAPGQSFRLSPEAKVQFGRAEGTIRT